MKRRLDFAVDMLRRLGLKQFDIDNCCWIDECIIRVSPSSNRQNDGFYRLAGEFDDVHEVLKQKVYQGAKVHVFVLLHSKIGVVGPYFVDEIFDERDPRATLTSANYIALLSRHVLPELKRCLTAAEISFNTCWWQQDGAHHTQRTLLWPTCDLSLAVA